MEQQRIYAAIDLKSFYASVECVERGLDPLDTCLVVADKSRTDKTICLAVSPALKAFGIPGRPRLFEVIRQVEDLNALRRALRPGRRFTGRSHLYSQLEADPGLELDYITAVPHMKRYMEKSAQVVGIYLQYMAPEDIHVYSVDEVLLDLTPYLKSYGWSARTMVQKMIRSVLRETGITATAGIGTNLYLCKVAMDIVAKHMAPDADGVRIASLTEQAYREKTPFGGHEKNAPDCFSQGRVLTRYHPGSACGYPADPHRPPTRPEHITVLTVQPYASVSDCQLWDQLSIGSFLLPCTNRQLSERKRNQSFSLHRL